MAYTGRVLDSFEFDAIDGEPCNPIHIDGKYYAVVYRRTSTSAFIKTFKITSYGIISLVDSWEFTTEGASLPRIYHLTGDLYAITYHYHWNISASGRLRTLHISPSGVITKSFDDTYTLLYASYQGFLLHISGSVYALAMGYSPSPHYILTFSIVSGAGGISFIDSYNYLTLGYNVEAAGKISSNIIYSIFSGDSNYSVLSFYVDNAGAIEEPYRDGVAYSCDPDHSFLSTTQITDNIYALAIRDGTTTHLTIHTFYISDAGDIQNTLVDDYGSAFGTLYYPGICYTGIPDKYFAPYSDLASDGIVIVMDINDSGTISEDAQYTSFEFDAIQCIAPRPLPLNGIFFPIFYLGEDQDGFITTVTYAPLSTVGHHELIMGVGP